MAWFDWEQKSYRKPPWELREQITGALLVDMGWGEDPKKPEKKLLAADGIHTRAAGLDQHIVDL
jgi:hypothetical protein